MSDHAFDAFTRRATDVVSRRNTFLTLGGAALRAPHRAMPAQTSAKKGKDRCKSQVRSAESGAAELCASAYAGATVTRPSSRATRRVLASRGARPQSPASSRCEDTKK